LEAHHLQRWIDEGRGGMPNLGPMELVIILVVVIMIFGVGKLPEVGGALGKAIREFRRATSEGIIKEPVEDKEGRKE